MKRAFGILAASFLSEAMADPSAVAQEVERLQSPDPDARFKFTGQLTAATINLTE